MEARSARSVAGEPRGGRIDGAKLALSFLMPLAGVAVALAFGAVALLALRVNPFVAYGAMLHGALGSTFGLTQTLVKATPLLLVGSGICIAFRANVINIGGEGQIIVGALAGAAIPLGLPGFPAWALIPLACLGGFLAGTAWGFIPGILKARLRVNEILSHDHDERHRAPAHDAPPPRASHGPRGREARGTFLAQSAQLPKQAWLPRLVPRTLLHAGAIVALALAVSHTFSYGRRPSASASARSASTRGPRATRASRCPSTRPSPSPSPAASRASPGRSRSLASSTASWTGSPRGYGFTGIVAALLGGLHPLGLIPSSILFGGLLVGADKMQRAVQVPSSLVTAILGLVVLFVSGSALITRRWSAKRAAAAAGRALAVDEACLDPAPEAGSEGAAL